jgi:hypothetical protein
LWLLGGLTYVGLACFTLMLFSAPFFGMTPAILLIAGVIGTKKFIYDLWGDTVNVASRMESYGIPGCIQVTEATYQLLKHKYHLEQRNAINVKGKGEMITYLLKGQIEFQM